MRFFGKIIGVSCYALLQETFLIQESKAKDFLIAGGSLLSKPHPSGTLNFISSSRDKSMYLYIVRIFWLNNAFA